MARSNANILDATYRSLCWDEEMRSIREHLKKNKQEGEQNRLMSVKDNLSMSSYLYNAGGERVWKFTGAVEQMTLNGKDYFDVANLTEKTLYTSPYMVLTNREYTKHYFTGSERIASKIGGGFALSLVDMRTDVADKNADYPQISNDLHDLLNRSGECGGIGNGFLSLHTGFEFLEESLHQDEIEENQYFYHSDHLGSSSWISDGGGYAYEHIEYLPYGELFIQQKAGDWDTRYKFTGKERDSETGFDYFGARYYSSDLSVWLSVDALASMYPSSSSYMYVRGNPVMLIDPNGMNDDEFKYDADKGEYTKISDLGGCDVDFYHHKGGEHDGQTEILNKKTGDKQYMSTSEFIEGYTHRKTNVNWNTIYSEWKNGTGPEKSLISGKDHQMNTDLLDSYQVNKAYEEYVANGEESKYYFEGDFGIIGLIRAGVNMTEQMVGSAGVSLYPVGNLLVITIMDSKSISSWTLNPFDGDEVNIPRTNASSPPKSTTYQTYVIIIERSKMKRINELYNEANLPD